LIFPSARSDANVKVTDGVIQEWSGFNLVDYHGAEPPEMHGGVEVMPWWPAWIGAEPRDLSGLDHPIVFASASIESSQEGRMAGSWSVNGLERTRASFIHAGELEFLLRSQVDPNDTRLSLPRKLQQFGNRHQPKIDVRPWTNATVITTKGVDWVTMFSAGIKNTFFDQSLRFGKSAISSQSVPSDFVGPLFGDKASRELLEHSRQILSLSGAFRQEIEALMDLLRDIGREYRPPEGPIAFLDGEVSSFEQ
jgi:hypothetical protein